MKTPEQFSKFAHLCSMTEVVLVSLLLTMNRFHTLCSSFSIVDFKQVNAGEKNTEKLNVRTTWTQGVN